ncbi:outer membrane biogenesis protein BamB [Rubripirellula lacrimiformis]|uniref:Outer membrane biogenesis protein BamB n=1 Tax=Rubripirellula lacrimiformis TaxID=1930273 RepID=A0A517N5Q9_9BACT|nr:PQQ-binding-like beta-propeller repeat protein [Rubripirellula lacrimiformis]QDT02441.1 outer membrane biogenesis protein BamB [Rubripirellula lacrimiformis]
MLAKELIDRLERLALLDQEIIEALREQLEQGGTRVTPEAVAKLLVDNGQLTHFQASKLIGELRSGQYESEADSGEADLTTIDEMGVVDDAFGEVVEVADVEVYEAEPMAVDVVPVEVDGDEVDESVPRPKRDRPSSRRPKPVENKSVWDSFKVYGYLGIIALLVLAGAGIMFVLSRENADEFIGNANKLYDQQNYQGAQDAYLSFLDSFGDEHQYSSVARTRVTMTELYKAAQFKQEPWQAVDLAKEKLPLIAEEEGMNEERGNLASLLVDIAANMAFSAGKAKETSEKESLLAKLDEHRTLMENPLFMPTSMRATLAGQIKGVEEARERVKRDISRNRRLDASEQSMKESLAEKKTKDAYDTRTELLRDFPELADDQRLVSQIQSASKIQKTLVAATANLPKTVNDPPESDSIKSIVLTTLAGRAAPDLQGETLFLRAGGSILAFNGENGQLRWRKFVGYAKDLPPVRIENGAGVLLSDSATLEVVRCDAENGRVSWRSQIDEPFREPISVKDDLYISTDSGRLLALDADSGDAKWGTQIPQELETGPGVDDRTSRAYLPGDHSNLYLINTRDGACVQSHYIGHRKGTIAVPPVPLLGHVFVIENAGLDYSVVHILRVDESGENIRVAQPPFRLTGNVRVTPIIQGRRLIVLTDRGEVTVYDIEPTAEKDQVTVAATLPSFYDQPTATQMAVGRTAMWITGTRVGRYELQINTGRVVRDWSLHELDTFIGQPFVSDDTLVHARRLRDTSAIRVTAANPKTGEEIWRTDVGVPVSMIKAQTDGKGFHVVTSQAALFALDRESLASGSTQGPIENPGKNAVGIRFEDPTAIDDVRDVLVNQVGGQTILVYNPTREKEKLRQVTMQLPAGKPSGGALIAGGGLFLPLSTGRAVLMNYQTGAMMATPFQPASDPVAVVDWTRPAALPDDADQVVVADSRKKIYRIRVAEQLRELSSKDVEYKFLGPAAGVNGTYVASTAGPAADFLVGFDMTSLNESFKTLLDGRIAWGPVAAGDWCLVETEDGNLRGFTADGVEAFRVPMPQGLPVGQPLMVDDTIVLCGKDGWIVAVDPAAGKLKGSSNLGQPISAKPMAIGNRLLVPGAEGVVYITEVPSE